VPVKAGKRVGVESPSAQKWLAASRGIESCVGFSQEGGKALTEGVQARLLSSEIT
jgi:hypothetical protein